jgi:hypothetical protein
LIPEEIKSRINSDNATIEVQNLASRLLPNDVKIKTYKTTIFACSFVWREARSLALRDKHRLKVFQKRVFRRTSGGRRKVDNSKLHN